MNKLKSTTNRYNEERVVNDYRSFVKNHAYMLIENQSVLKKRMGSGNHYSTFHERIIEQILFLKDDLGNIKKSNSALEDDLAMLRRAKSSYELYKTGYETQIKIARANNV